MPQPARPAKSQVTVPAASSDAVRAALAGDGAPIGDPALAGIVLTAWACLLGYLVAEIFGSLTALITSADLLYQAHVRTVMAGTGFQPALA